MSTCGECKYGIALKGPDGQIDFSRRECYGAPPTPIFVFGPKGGQPIGVRPSVTPQDPACSLFKQKISLDSGTR